jgi:hypothetical protein
MHTRCNKDLIAYRKSNGITTMKKHIKFEHFSLLKNLLENATNLALRFPFNHKSNKKRAHVSCSFFNFWFFSTSSKFKKDNATQVGLLEDLTMFVIKRLMPLRTIESIWL